MLEASPRDRGWKALLTSLTCLLLESWQNDFIPLTSLIPPSRGAQRGRLLRGLTPEVISPHCLNLQLLFRCLLTPTQRRLPLDTPSPDRVPPCSSCLPLHSLQRLSTATTGSLASHLGLLLTRSGRCPTFPLKLLSPRPHNLLVARNW